MCIMHAMLRSSEDPPMARNAAETAKKSDQKQSIACVRIFRCIISASGVLDRKLSLNNQKISQVGLMKAFESNRQGKSISAYVNEILG